MTAQAQQSNFRNRYKVFSTILVAGFFASLLDADAAVLSFFIKGGKDPLRIFQYIASAVLGKEAYSGGWLPIVLGILFHFIIAYSFTVFFFFLYKRWSFLSNNLVMTAVLYGIFIWVIMNLFVLRMTNLTLMPFVPGNVLIGISILIIAIGLPITFLADKFFSKTYTN